jgi:hypothetical protein
MLSRIGPGVQVLGVDRIEEAAAQATMPDFFRGVLTNAEDMTRTFDIYAGKEPMRTLFNDEAVKRHSATAASGMTLE